MIDTVAVSAPELSAGLTSPSEARGEEFDPVRPPSARRVGQVALALVAVQTVLRSWAVLEGFFYEDDYLFIYTASRSRLSVDFLLEDYNGHFMPAVRLLAWMLQHLAPMSFTTIAFVLVLIQVAASLTVWLLIRELVGARVGALIPFAVYLFSPLTLTAFLWYGASIQAVPLQLVMAGSLLFYIRYLRHGRRGDAIRSMLILTLGLAIWNKALVVLPVLALVTILWLSSGGLLRRMQYALTKHVALWSAYMALAFGYLALYVARSRSESGGGWVSSTPGIVRETIVNGFVPSLFGGPYSALPSGVNGGPEPSSMMSGLFLGVFVVVVVATLAMHRGAWRAWLLLGTYLMLDVLLLAISRGNLSGPEIGRNMRFFADSSVILAVALAMALLPASERACRQPQRDIGRLLDRPIVAGLVIFIYALSCGFTSVEIVQAWSATSAEPYVRTAQDDLKRLGDIVIFDHPAPPDVLSSWFLEDRMVSRVLGGLPEQPRFDQPTDVPYRVNDQGHILPAEFAPATSSLPGPDPQCGWLVAWPATATIPMETVLFPLLWTVQITYLAGSDTRATVVIGDRITPLRLEKGLHSVFIRHAGPVDSVEIAGRDAGQALCVTDVTVGQV